MTKSAPAPVISKVTHKKAGKGEEGERQSKNTVAIKKNSQP